MQALAKWLLARPYNGVLGLAITVLLPAPQLTSGAIMTLLVLAEGARQATVKAFAAAAILMATSLLLGGTLETAIELTAGTWVPVMLLAITLVTIRSLTLTIQVSVIVAILVFLVFQVAVSDPAEFWQPYMDTMIAVIRENGLQLNTELLTAEVMTVSAVLVFWMLYTAAVLIGYSLYRRLPSETSDFGWFRDLNFGRVIAFTMALAVLLAFVSGASWLQNVAFILFVMFMMQGLSIVHWLHSEGTIPVVVVISVYVLLPFLQVLLVMVLALVGYTDAWFALRRRFKKA